MLRMGGNSSLVAAGSLGYCLHERIDIAAMSISSCRKSNHVRTGTESISRRVEFYA
jgi:hypothetical protein